MPADEESDVIDIESKAEEGEKEFSKPEFRRRIIYLIVGLVALGIISILPIGMDPLAKRALGVLALVTILWVTEAFPLGMTALFGVSLLGILKVIRLEDTFVGFKNTALFFLIGALSFGIAMQKTNLHKRFALKLLERFGKSSSMIIFSFIILGTFMSMTMPSHAVAALLLPVLILIVKAGNIKRDQNFGIAIFLALTYSTSVGSIGTLLGGARNVLAIGILESTIESAPTITFLDWAIAGIPIAIVLMLLVYFTLKIVYPWKEVEAERIREDIKEEVDELGGISRGEKKAGIIFGITVFFWIFLGSRIGLSVIAILGFFLLVASRTITWRDIKAEMPWDLIFLYGGALTLSHALTTTEAVGFLSNNLVGFIGENPLLVMIAFLILVIGLSNLMSNSAATAVILPIAITTIVGLGAGEYSGELVSYLIAMGSAMVFLLPIGTPSAAIVYSSGYVDVKDLIKAGTILTAVCTVAFLTFGLGWWKLIGIW